MTSPIKKIIVSCIIIVGCSSSFLVSSNAPIATPLILKYPAYFGNRIEIPVDNLTTEEGVQLGRRLFYERKLSANNMMSCGTCHIQAKAFTDGKSFSGGVDGTLTDRSTMSLTNLLWVQNFFWDGRVAGLEKQAEFPLTNEHEMGQTLDKSVEKLKATKQYALLFKKAFGTEEITGDLILKALAQFERTLISANSKYDHYLRGEYNPTVAELNGIRLFFSDPDPQRNKRGAACGRCHGGPKTYSELFHNNGLDSIPEDGGREKITGQEYDRGRFRVAPLRNIAVTAPYMHDGRFSTLDDVLDHYNEHIQQSPALSIVLQNNSNDKNGKTLGLTAKEKTDIVSFLRMLTDSSFITDKRFSNPFLE